MCPFINRSPSCLRSKVVTKVWDMISRLRHNGHYYYYHDLTWMRCHRGHKPHWPRTLFDSSIPPWILLDFNIDPWPHHHGTNTYPKPCKDTPTKNTFYDPLNDSPGLLLFGLVFPFLEQHFLVSGYLFSLSQNISLFHFTKYLVKKRGVLSFRILWGWARYQL